MILSGCGAELEPGQGTTSSAIINGQVDTGHPAVGQLIISQGGGYASACTATLIGSKTVLSAAHCVDGLSSGYFRIGGYQYTTAKLIPHPDFSMQNPFSPDIAVITLQQVVSGITPKPLATNAPKVGDSLVIVGFGITSEYSQDMGTKRVTTNTIEQLGNNWLRYFGSSGSEGTICSGDSGGPSFRVDNGVETLVGIHSTSSVPCGNDGNDIRVDTYYNWIVDQGAGDVGPYASDKTPPQVTIQSPAPGARVEPSFNVTVTAEDVDSGVASIKLFLSNKLIGTKTTSPATFSLTNVPVAQHSLRAEAVDQAGNLGTSQTVTISVEQPGQPPSNQPPTGQSPGEQPPGQQQQPQPGTYGAHCTNGSDCHSSLCASDSALGSIYCTQLCDADTACPQGSDCVRASDTESVCALRGDSQLTGEGAALLGGCSLGHTPIPSVQWGLFLIAALVLLRRRRRL